MIVKELLINALSNANHTDTTGTADPGEIDSAKRHFDSALRKYSGSQLLTAYQKQFDFTTNVAKFTIGRPNIARDYTIKMVDELVEHRDYNPVTKNYGIRLEKDIYVNNNKPYVMSTRGATVHCQWGWCELQGEYKTTAFTDIIPDIYCLDIVRPDSLMVQNNYGKWVKVDHVNLNEFWLDDRKIIYSYAPKGQNLIEIQLTDYLAGKNFKVVYGAEMTFKKNDQLYLPSDYIELLTLATTINILKEDLDSDPRQVNQYEVDLSKLEAQIASNNVTDRPLKRTYDEESRIDSLFNGSFIYR